MSSCVVYVLESTSAKAFQCLESSISVADYVTDETRFNHGSDIDVIIFHESTLTTDQKNRVLQDDRHPGGIKWQQITFDYSGGKTWEQNKERFLSGPVFMESILSSYDYIMILETETVFHNNATFDINTQRGNDWFDDMVTDSCEYRYNSQSLIDADSALTTSINSLDTTNKMPYSGVVLGKLSFFRSDDYQNLFSSIDTGGFFTDDWKWCQVVHQGAVKLLDPSKVSSLSNLTYWYNTNYTL